MICAVILAAGESRRMGVQKLLLPFDGRTVIGCISPTSAMLAASASTALRSISRAREFG